MAGVLRLTRHLRAGSSSSLVSFRSRLRFLTFEESRTHMHSLALRSRLQFLNWCHNGLRPPFIPSNPDQIYRNAGWISFPDWLGYPRRAPKAVVRDAKRVVDYTNSERVKAEFVDFVTQTRPDIEIKRIPQGFGANHRFRILQSLSGTGSETESDQWVLIQIRWTKANAARSGLFQIKHSADPEMGVIIIADCGVVAGIRRELVSDYRSADFKARDSIFATLAEWWSSCPRLSEENCMQKLRSASNRSFLNSNSTSELRRAYFDPLRLSIHAPGDLFESQINVILGGRFRVLIRNASCTPRKPYWYLSLTVRGCRPAEADEIDFVIATGFGTREGAVPNSVPPIFLFPRSFLLQKGYMATAEQPGKHSIYLHPPWKKNARKISAVRKAEQAPFFVDSVERFAEILKEYGDTEAGDPANRSKKFEATPTDSESAKAELSL